jgi:hypothetical protein
MQEKWLFIFYREQALISLIENEVTMNKQSWNLKTYHEKQLS